MTIFYKNKDDNIFLIKYHQYFYLIIISFKLNGLSKLLQLRLLIICTIPKISSNLNTLTLT